MKMGNQKWIEIHNDETTKIWAINIRGTGVLMRVLSVEYDGQESFKSTTFVPGLFVWPDGELTKVG